MADVEFNRYNSSPPPKTKVRTVTIDGVEYQVVIPAKEDGTIIDLSLAATVEKQNDVLTGIGYLLSELQTKADVTEKQPSLIYGKTSGDVYYIPRLDSLTRSLFTITTQHGEVHEGHFFRSGMNFSLSNGQVATFTITTPNTPTWCHLDFNLTTTADGTFTLLEDVTSFSGGVAITPLNHNRNAGTASVMTCLSGVTGANQITPTGGTPILNAELATGKGATLDRNSGEEFILKQNSKYLFRYTNGTSANVIRLLCQWYEHESL